MATRAWAVLHVRDLPASLAFYTERLGWRRGEQPSGDIAFVHDHTGDALLLAGPRAGDVGPYLEPDALVKRPEDLLRYPAANLDAQLDSLGARGVTAHIVETPWRDRELRVPAPDGTTVAFVAPASLSPEETLELYQAAPHALDAALTGLAADDLDLAPVPGAWTIRQIVHHIVDGDDLWAMVIKAALAAPGCTYEQDWYDTSNTSAETLGFATLDIAPALALFRAHRTYIAALLRHLPDAWDRHVRFARAGMPEAQQVTAGFVVRTQARHALEHIAAIHAIHRAHGR